MSGKGKKFDAHEKHFAGEKLRLEKIIDRLYNESLNIKSENRIIKIQNEALVKENKRLLEEIDRITKYANLTDEEKKTLLDKIKSEKKLSEMFSMFSSLSYYR